MAKYDAYDARLESLVVETLTKWDVDISKISLADRKSIAAAIHRLPSLASKIEYERTHTGFIRHITITEAELGKLEQLRSSSAKNS